MIGNGATRVLLAVVGGATSVREVAAAVPCAVSTVVWHLEKLRADGLVAWEDGKARTLRSTVAPVDLSALRFPVTPAEEPPCESNSAPTS